MAVSYPEQPTFDYAVPTSAASTIQSATELESRTRDPPGASIKASRPPYTVQRMELEQLGKYPAIAIAFSTAFNVSNIWPGECRPGTDVFSGSSTYLDPSSSLSCLEQCNVGDDMQSGSKHVNRQSRSELVILWSPYSTSSIPAMPTVGKFASLVEEARYAAEEAFERDECCRPVSLRWKPECQDTRDYKTGNFSTKSMSHTPH